MSTWRRKAIECVPEIKKDLEDPSTSIYGAFFEILPTLVKAHQQNDTDRLEKIYAFAEWCFNQKEEDLWNAAGVAFYEHLGDYEETRSVIQRWISPALYKDIRGLIELRVTKQILGLLDNKMQYSSKIY